MAHNYKYFDLGKVHYVKCHSGFVNTIRMKKSSWKLKRMIGERISNGQLAATISEVRTSLGNQLFSAIKWEQTMSELYAHRAKDTELPRTLVIGPPSNQLGLLLKKTNYMANQRLVSTRLVLSESSETECRA
ncbi:hypothetical protein ACOME3_002405 [Neoechinorhynchus agilis]